MISGLKPAQEEAERRGGDDVCRHAQSDRDAPYELECKDNLAAGRHQETWPTTDLEVTHASDSGNVKTLLYKRQYNAR